MAKSMFNRKRNQYEYTAFPIIQLDIPNIGVTIMDGPFVTLLPYGKTGSFSLYHVNHSVIQTEVSDIFNKEWLSIEKTPLNTNE